MATRKTTEKEKEKEKVVKDLKKIKSAINGEEEKEKEFDTHILFKKIFNGIYQMILEKMVAQDFKVLNPATKELVDVDAVGIIYISDRLYKVVAIFNKVGEVLIDTNDDVETKYFLNYHYELRLNKGKLSLKQDRVPVTAFIKEDIDEENVSKTIKNYNDRMEAKAEAKGIDKEKYPGIYRKWCTKEAACTPLVDFS